MSESTSGGQGASVPITTGAGTDDQASKDVTSKDSSAIGTNKGLSEKLSKKPGEVSDSAPVQVQAPEAGEVEQRRREVFKKVEAHVSPNDTEIPDHSAMRKTETHRQAEVGPKKELHTGDTSSVNPAPDRQAPGMQITFRPEGGDHQITEQPDAWAVGDLSREYKRPKKAGRKKAENVPSSENPQSATSTASKGLQEVPAQYGEGEQLPAQYSFPE